MERRTILSSRETIELRLANVRQRKNIMQRNLPPDMLS